MSVREHADYDTEVLSECERPSMSITSLCLKFDGFQDKKKKVMVTSKIQNGFHEAENINSKYFTKDFR